METFPAVYSPTGYGIHDGEAVVQTPHGVKTLQGAGVDAITELLRRADGETAASELVAGVPDASENHIELLYDHTLAYDGRAIPTGLQCGRLLEPTLPALPPASHHEVPARLDAGSVAVYGDREPMSSVCDRLRAAGVTADSAVADPDVIVLSELLERSDAWRAANERWATGEATLVATRLTERGWRLGPVLTADARACLHCVSQRVDANGAGGRLVPDRIVGEPPHESAYVDTVTELLFRTLLGQLPRYLDEQFLVYDHYDQHVETPRVFALPGCEVCDDG